MHRAVVLVIDDDELVCDILKTCLNDAGYIVDAVLEPEIALKRFREQQYDAVIIDVVLPKIMGTDLLEKFKDIDSETSIILVTAYPGIETAQKAVQLNAFDYVSKPFELRDIVAKTKEAVEETHKLREKKEYERTLEARLSENLKDIEFQSNALKIEQERFYGIFKSANFGLMVLNGFDEKIILINDQCKRLLNISNLSDQHCFDKDYHHLIPAEMSGQIDLMVHKLRENPSFEKTDPVQFGNEKILEFQSYPVMSDGLMLAIAIIIYDITERKQLEKQLLMTSKLAGIGELAAGIAHEINNPIGFVKSNMGTLNEYVDELMRLFDMFHSLMKAVENGDNTSEIIQRIRTFEKQIDSNFVLNDFEKIVNENQDGLNRVAKIIQDLRTFTRFDEEKKSLVNINKIINEALNLTRNECKYKANVIRELSEIPDTLGFGNQLAQVIVNLIINAVHAIDKKGRITVRSFQEGKKIIIEVSDNGKGMTQETLERVFDPFFTTKPSGEGTGLGLSIAQDIITKHNGKISVQSEIGKGTTFRVELPAQLKTKEAVKT